ncbi:uncharacterized protein LOC133451746 [Cololabis saira]|uniref:uncharacterized protein LOC133451746 n=1 Tax=Cololabis saira TaxID=129043 RepID=UPI002AD3F9DA|nr:uncharacterized protein LOC133451746 [Cololabis saira]
MSRSSPRPGRPGSAGCRNGSGSRREPINDHSCMLRIGERLMRAGSEGNLVQKPAGNPVQKPARTHHGPAAASPAPRAANGFPPDLDLQNRAGESRRQNSSTDEGIISESSSSASAPEDLRSDPQLKKQISNLGLQGNSDSSFGGSPAPCSSGVGGGPAPCSSGVGGGPAPCSSGVGGGPAPCSSGAGRDDEENLEKLILQQCDVVRKKQAVLEHLREQSPHHTSLLSGSQLMKNQVRHTCGTQHAPGLGCCPAHLYHQP